MVSAGIVKQTFGLVARGLVPADHVEVDHGAGGLERTQGVRRHVEGSEQAALLRGEYDEEDGPLRLLSSGCARISGQGMGERHDAHRSRPVVIGAVPDLITTHAVVVVMSTDEDGLRRAVGGRCPVRGQRRS